MQTCRVRFVEALPALICLLLAGCGVRYVADYDQTIVDGVSAFLAQSESFFSLLERHAGTEATAYENCTSFYEEATTDLRMLMVHADAIPQDSITSEQLSILMVSLDTLESIHRRGNLTPAQIEGSLRPSFESSCRSILTFEYAKKR